MKIAPREIILALITAAVALFGVSMMLAKPQVERLKELKMLQKSEFLAIEQSRRLINQKDMWEKKFSELSKMLPQHPPDRNMDVHWLSRMDALAAKHNVKINKRQAGQEKKYGDVYELPIECRDWESELEAITHFLFDLRTEGAMLDIRQLRIKPKGKGRLGGQFQLYCAYTRKHAEPVQ